ncbi:hypothetical protein PQR05_29845 [Paraburkholderia sediminicola]|uniref:hypothetical protein n=1 Tax=Paraburkholderia sediminicola TaxID=458836 RepID=UPI0038BDF643
MTDTRTVSHQHDKLVPFERTYNMRVRGLIALNTALQEGKDHDDALQAAWEAMLKSAPDAATEAPVAWVTTYECPPKTTVRLLVDMSERQRAYVMRYAKTVVALVPIATLKDDPPTVTRYI